MTTDPEQSAAAGARLSLNLPPVPQAAGMARRALRDALRSWQLDHLTDTAILLVSELVGNAIRHTQADDLRHTGLTWMADAGVPVHVLRKIAGHGSLTTTQRYLHPDAQSITAAGTALSAHLSAKRSPGGPRLRVV